MRKVLLFLLLFLPFSFLFSQTEYVISTTLGDMRIRLYDDTPHHSAHFRKLVGRKFFDGSLFTRVIPEFMIQGGALDSKNAAPGAFVGAGSSTMLLAPEFRKNHCMKKGALCAPRQPDKYNPKKRSDASQFFIVQGRVYTSGALDTMELSRNVKYKNEAYDLLFLPVKPIMDSLRIADPREYNRRAAQIRAAMDSTVRANPNALFFTPEQREAYTTVGGCLHLEGEYTIFGEVIEGLEVIDLIATQACDKRDRPKRDVRIIIKP